MQKLQKPGHQHLISISISNLDVSSDSKFKTIFGVRQWSVSFMIIFNKKEYMKWQNWTTCIPFMPFLACLHLDLGIVRSFDTKRDQKMHSEVSISCAFDDLHRIEQPMHSNWFMFVLLWWWLGKMNNWNYTWFAVTLRTLFQNPFGMPARFLLLCF